MEWWIWQTWWIHADTSIFWIFCFPLFYFLFLPVKTKHQNSQWCLVVNKIWELPWTNYLQGYLNKTDDIKRLEKHEMLWIQQCPHNNLPIVLFYLAQIPNDSYCYSKFTCMASLVHACLTCRFLFAFRVCCMMMSLLNVISVLSILYSKYKISHYPRYMWL